MKPALLLILAFFPCLLYVLGVYVGERDDNMKNRPLTVDCAFINGTTRSFTGVQQMMHEDKTTVLFMVDGDQMQFPDSNGTTCTSRALR